MKDERLNSALDEGHRIKDLLPSSVEVPSKKIAFIRLLVYSFISFAAVCRVLLPPLTPPPSEGGGGVEATVLYEISESRLFSLSSCVLHPLSKQNYLVF